MCGESGRALVSAIVSPLARWRTRGELSLPWRRSKGTRPRRHGPVASYSTNVALGNRKGNKFLAYCSFAYYEGSYALRPRRSEPVSPRRGGGEHYAWRGARPS